MLVDANILLYAVDTESRFHSAASAWLTDALNGPRRIGLPWQSTTAFLRIATNPRAARNPLSPREAWEIVDAWLTAPAAWIPMPGPGYVTIFSDLIVRYDPHAGLISDAAIAALAIEHGVEVVSADSDFARFSEIRWVNPLACT
ncbi:MAG: PIN domain-containing protein [Acidimicrobiales bacterium]|nr:PIN domain-containing protein [Acidimicrobiales bacterium]